MEGRGKTSQTDHESPSFVSLARLLFFPPFSDDAMTAFRIGVPPSGLVRMFCAALIAK